VNWQAPFLALLPAIERQAQRSLVRLPRRDREEARQAIVAYAAVAYARLAELDKAGLGYPGPLAHYGFKQYCAGRLVGGRTNSRDLCSPARRRSVVERFDDQPEVLPAARQATPAERAALRVDLGDWLNTLSPRRRLLAQVLAQGEETGEAARTFGVTPGRVSQLRRELYENWRRFLGEPVEAAG
jgi:hypothetical protein